MIDGLLMSTPVGDDNEAAREESDFMLHLYRNVLLRKVIWTKSQAKRAEYAIIYPQGNRNVKVIIDMFCRKNMGHNGLG